MNIEEFRNYCLSKPLVTEHFPFDETTLVFKVANKMFALSSLKGWEANTPAVNLKCDPETAIELREKYEDVQPGYHMSKKHWNTISINTEEIKEENIYTWIDDSYILITQSLPKKKAKSNGFHLNETHCF